VEVSHPGIYIRKAIIRRKFTVITVKLFAPFIARLEIVSRSIQSNRFSSDLNILHIKIGSKTYSLYKVIEILQKL
jgi:hypothetical protein